MGLRMRVRVVPCVLSSLILLLWVLLYVPVPGQAPSHTSRRLQEVYKGIYVKKLANENVPDVLTTARTSIQTTVSDRKASYQESHVSVVHNTCLEVDNNMQPGQVAGQRRLVSYNSTSKKEESLQIGLFHITSLPAKISKDKQFIDQFSAIIIPLIESLLNATYRLTVEKELQAILQQTKQDSTRGRHQVYVAYAEKCPDNDKMWCIRQNKSHNSTTDDELSKILLKVSLNPSFIHFFHSPTGVCYHTVYIMQAGHLQTQKPTVQGALGNVNPAASI